MMKKEQLSTLMDDELVSHEFCHSLSNTKSLKQHWHRYHLVRDSLRGEVTSLMSFDIVNNVALAIESETMYSASEQLFRSNSNKSLQFWRKIKPWFTQAGQVSMAAMVSLVVILGYQRYFQPEEGVSAELTAFNTFSIGGLASPVSYGTSIVTANDGLQERTQRKRMAILHDYELQRRLYAEPVDFSLLPTPIDSLQLGNNQ